MPDYSNAKKTNLSDLESQEQFLLHSPGEIAHVLLDLGKRPDIITAYFGGNSRYLLTAVVTVLAERGLVVLDYGPDEAANEAALKEGRMLCVTKHERISIKFTLTGMQRARYQGHPVIAAPLPDTLFRLQRREFFRVRTPMGVPATCIVPWSDGEKLEQTVADIGYGGLALIDADMSFSGELRDTLSGCILKLPEHGEVEVDLEVRNILPIKNKDGSEYQRIGCQFGRMSLDRSAKIQRYINQLQIAQKAISGS